MHFHVLVWPPLEVCERWAAQFKTEAGRIVRRGGMDLVHARTHARTHALLPMKAIYSEVLADLDARIARLQGTRDAIASIADADDNRVDERHVRQRRGPRRVGRTKVGGGDQLVLEV